MVISPLMASEIDISIVGEISPEIPISEGAKNNEAPAESVTTEHSSEDNNNLVDEESIDYIPIESEPYQIIINEIMIGSEVNPEKDSWVELYNPESTAVNLEGWQIKGVTEGGRWINLVSGAEATIPAKGYFLISRYSNSSYSALDIKPQSVKSSIFLAWNEGTITVELSDSEGKLIDTATIEQMDSERFQSYERDDEENTWSQSENQKNIKEGLTQTFASPGAANKKSEEASEESQNSTENNDTKEIIEEEKVFIEEKVPYPFYSLINEIMVNPEGADMEGEWIELFNNSKEAIDLGGWYLDDAEGGSSPYRLRDNTWIGAGSHRMFSAPELNLTLKNSEDTVRLLDPNKDPKEVIQYSEAKEQWSFAKNQDGTFNWTPEITPGNQNQFPDPPKTYQTDDITFKSILPNPEGKDGGAEIITLKSHLSETADLKDWKLINLKGKEFFIDGYSLQPMGQLKIDPSTIGLTLTNTADQLSLIDPAGNLIDRISWNDAENERLIYKPDTFPQGLSATVTRIIDGDTISAIIDGEEWSIRLIGIDAPETVHPDKAVDVRGFEAKNILEERLLGRKVILEFDETKTDKYNRLLAYVFLDETMINEVLLKSGWAKAYLNFPFSLQNEFSRLEQDARQQRVGLWAGETKENDKETESDNDEEVSEDEIETMVENPESKIQDETSSAPCPTEGLKIESFLPNAEKGVSEEFIRLINESNQRVCLNGWQLDDITGSGSKPFTIKGGAIAPGGMRTFRKSESGLSLNNSNDCVNLINPMGENADRICYTKTHKNERFTHDGGDWQPIQKPVKTSTSSSKKTSTKTVKRETEFAQWELTNEQVEGEIVFIYEEGKTLFLKNENKVIPISYASAKMNISAAKELLNLESPVTIDLRKQGETRDLIGIYQDAPTAQEKSKESTESGPLPMMAIALFTGTAYVSFGIRKKQKPQFITRKISAG